MNRMIFIIVGFLVLSIASVGFAQRGEPYGRRNSPLSDSPCWTKPYLEATPEQLKSLESLQRSFYKEILALQKEYSNLHHELRSRLGIPKPEAREVIEKQRKISDLQKKIDEISIQHLLKARALFTPDQLSRLPSGCSLGFNYGQGRGWSRGRGPGNRF